jgi:putative tricarboxylic transport membrane protein
MWRKPLKTLGAAALISALLLSAHGFTGSASAADAWKPTGIVHMIIPFPAGGGSDLFARTFMQSVEAQNPGITTVPENQDGGQGAPAHVYVARQKGDGNYLMPDGGSTISLPLVSDVPYKLSDFTPLFRVTLDPLALVVSADSPYKTLNDLLKSGKVIKVGIGGIAASDAALPPLLESKSSAKLDTVILDGGSEVVRAVLGGDIVAGTSNPSEIESLVKANRLRVIAMFTAERVNGWPDTPTAKEQGIDIVWGQPRNVFGPAGLSEEQVKFWVDAAKVWMASDSFKTWVDRSGSVPSFISGKELDDYLEQYGKIFQELTK